MTEFKAKCLALLSEVGRNGGTITVTKRGKPLASVGPAPRRRIKSSEGILAGKIPEILLSPDYRPLLNMGRGKWKA